MLVGGSLLLAVAVALAVCLQAAGSDVIGPSRADQAGAERLFWLNKLGAL